MEELLKKLLKETKQSLSIIETSTMKDEEILMLIKAGIEDFKRLGITEKEIELNNALIHSAIIMFVKARFGNVDIKEKMQSDKVYEKMVSSITLSKNSMIKNKLKKEELEKLKEKERTED